MEDQSRTELTASVKTHFDGQDQVTYYLGGEGETMAPVEHRLLDYARSHLGAGFTALDMGAGVGKISSALLGAGARHVTLVELSEGMLDAARDRVPEPKELVVDDMSTWTPMGAAGTACGSTSHSPMSTERTDAGSFSAARRGGSRQEASS